LDLLSIDDLRDDQIETIIDRGLRYFEDNRSTAPRPTELSRRIVFNLFYENSTRTLMSFAAATLRLGASPLSLPVEQSSVKKGETLADTARTLNAMRPDLLVIRRRHCSTPPQFDTASAASKA
jgi:aspartate carbamoyltransferase catalytic subunit